MGSPSKNKNKKPFERITLNLKEAEKFVKRLRFPAGMAGCWLWDGNLDGDHYPRFWLRGGYVMAHITVYQRLKGDFDQTLQVGHCCNIRHCCNPGHLKMQTQGENLSERVYPPRQSRAQYQRTYRAKQRQRDTLIASLQDQIKTNRLKPAEIFPNLSMAVTVKYAVEPSNDPNWEPIEF